MRAAVAGTILGGGRIRDDEDRQQAGEE